MILPIGTLTGLNTPSTTKKHQEPRRQLGLLQRFEMQPKAWAGLINKVHLLHETTLSSLGEVAVLSNAQTVKENEETMDYIPNKRSR